MRVYLAGRYGRRAELMGYAAELEAGGRIAVTSRWLDGTHDVPTGNPVDGILDEVLPADLQSRFALEDLSDIDDADVLVAFTETPCAGTPCAGTSRGGRHVEAGYAIARGMPVIAVGPRENIFYALPDVLLAEDWDRATQLLEGMALGHAAWGGGDA